MRALPFVSILLLTGCATQPGKDHGAANVNAAGTDIQCHSEQLTGTMLSKQVCTTKAQRDAQQAAVDDLKNAAAHSVGCSGSAAAGCQ